MVLPLLANELAPAGMRKAGKAVLLAVAGSRAAYLRLKDLARLQHASACLGPSASPLAPADLLARVAHVAAWRFPHCVC